MASSHSSEGVYGSTELFVQRIARTKLVCRAFSLTRKHSFTEAFLKDCNVLHGECLFACLFACWFCVLLCCCLHLFISFLAVSLLLPVQETLLNLVGRMGEKSLSFTDLFIPGYLDHTRFCVASK